MLNHNPELSARIFEFLAGRSRGEFAFAHDGWNYALLRSRYDDETDFIYLLRQYHGNTAHSMNDKADRAGIYSHLTGKLYDAGYELRFLDDRLCENLPDICGRLAQLTADAVLRKIDGRPVPETDDSDKLWYDRDYYLAYTIDKEAAEYFYKGTQPSYCPRIDKDKFTLRDIIGGINHPEETADRLANAFILSHSKIINQRLWEISLLPDKIAELEATPGEHHFRRRIARSIGDEKMVRLEILKDGIPCECRIEAYELKRVDDTYYSEYRMDSHGRAAFIGAYGSRAHLFPSNIQRICYGRKTLYEKEAE